MFAYSSFASSAPPAGIGRSLGGAVAIAAGLMLAAAGLAVSGSGTRPAPVSLGTFVAVPGARLDYAEPGEFTRDGRAAPAPRHGLDVSGFAIMDRQVSAAAYAACVAAGDCPPAAAPASPASGADLPAVGVSWLGAQAFAHWLSRRTGETYRLPSDPEWALAAGNRYRGDVEPIDPDDPSKAWLARYARETEETSVEPAQPAGSFGANDKGLADIGGNVWEWTDACFTRTPLEPARLEAGAGAGTAAAANCGLRLVEGRHRAFIPDFIGDAKGTGCAAGLPPSHLGFRLIREGRRPGLFDRFRVLFGA